MKTLIAGSAAVLCAVLLCGCHTPPKSTAWEYKQIDAHLSDQQLNDYAKQGWLVDQVVKGRTAQNNEWVYILLKRHVR